MASIGEIRSEKIVLCTGSASGADMRHGRRGVLCINKAAACKAGNLKWVGCCCCCWQRVASQSGRGRMAEKAEAGRHVIV